MYRRCRRDRGRRCRFRREGKLFDLHQNIALGSMQIGMRSLSSSKGSIVLAIKDDDWTNQINLIFGWTVGKTFGKVLLHLGDGGYVGRRLSATNWHSSNRHLVPMRKWLIAGWVLAAIITRSPTANAHYGIPLGWVYIATTDLDCDKFRCDIIGTVEAHW